MADRVKINLGGNPADATRVTIEHASESFNEYLLGDGTTIRIKLVLADVLRIDGQYDEDRNPMYVVRNQNVIVVNSPDNLKKPT